MKKLLAVIILAPFIIGAFTGVTYGATGFTHSTVKTGKTYTTKFYAGGRYLGKVKTAKKVKVKVVNSGKLTAKTLEHRKNKYIVVEVIRGKCVDVKGNGRTSDGYYISYKSIEYERGARYMTYCVYANNNYVDDIVIRADKEL